MAKKFLQIHSRTFGLFVVATNFPLSSFTISLFNAAKKFSLTGASGTPL